MSEGPGFAASSSAPLAAMGQPAAAGGHERPLARTPDGPCGACASVPEPSERPPGAAGPASSAERVPGSVLGQLEQRFGTSFDSVRIDGSDEAVRETSKSGARAITQGERIMFAPGQLQPRSVEGQHLLAHELAHVVQQRRGAFPSSGVSGSDAQSRVDLEAEAEQAASGFTGAASSRPVQGRAPMQMMPSLGLFDVIAAASSGVEHLADMVADELRRAGDDTVAALLRLRQELAGVTELHLEPERAAELERLYQRLSAAAPSWLPVPTISFAGPNAQHVGPVAIPAAVILVLLAFVLILMWIIITNSDPDVRRARERDVQRLIDLIREGTRPVPAPIPVGGPVAEPLPTPSPARAEPISPPVAVPVPIAGTRYRNQKCSDDRLTELHNLVHPLCDQGFSCSDTVEREFLGITTRKAFAKAIAGGGGFTRDEILRRIALAQACKTARQNLQDECFIPDPTDQDYLDHMQQLRDVDTAVATCLAKLAARGMAPP